MGGREGHTTEPLYEAARLNEGHLWSVDLNDPTEYQPNNGHYTFTKQDSIKFLEEWPKAVSYTHLTLPTKRIV